LGPSGLNGLGWIILSLILGPGRVDPMGLTTEKADFFHNNSQVHESFVINGLQVRGQSHKELCL
jgi:hypothetical protein